MLHNVDIDRRKRIFYEDQSGKWTTHHTSELFIGMGDPNGHVGRNIGGFQRVHEGFSIGKGNLERRTLLELSDAKHICIANT